MMKTQMRNEEKDFKFESFTEAGYEKIIVG